MHKPRRIKITDLNPNLICVLCGGYYVDATTIIECLHSFCKACIVRYLETNRYCPICDVQVHKTKPLQNIRADKTLQDIVYKLVPSLFQNEMRCRREFYAKHPEAQPTSRIDAGDLTDHAYFYAADEAISLSLEYYQSEKSPHQKIPCSARRYFRCPAAVTVAHLQKLIRAKFGLTTEYRVDIMYMDKILNEELTLMDVAYIYSWRRKAPLDLTYRIFECCWANNKKIKLEHNPVAVVKDEHGVEKEQEMETHSALETAAKMETETEDNINAETWKEVQLQISENGVMSVTDISISQSEANNNTLENCIAEAAYCLKTKYLDNEKVLKTELIKDLKDSAVCEDAKNTPATVSPTLTTTTSSVSLAVTSVTSTSVTTTLASTALQSWPKKQDQQNTTLGLTLTSTFAETGNTKSNLPHPVKQNHPSVVSQHSLPSVVTSSGSSAVTTTTPIPSIASQHKNNLSVFTKKGVEINRSIRKQQPLQSQPLALKVSSPVTTSTGKSRDSTTNNAMSKRDPLKTAVVAPTQSILTNSSASRKLLASSGSSAPVGYKTLKAPPKSWNQSITRLSFLSSAKNHTYMANAPPSNIPCESRTNDLSRKQQGAEIAITSGSNKLQGPGPAMTSTAGVTASPTKPNRFFKMRMPRYLGNPASGVKPMYPVAASVGKQDLVSQTTSQTPSSSKPLYLSNPHNIMPAYNTSGGSKPPYSGGNATQTHLHSMVAFPLGMQQTSKVDSCSPLTNAKHFPLPSMNQQTRDCSSSTAHLLSQTSLDIKPIYTSSNQQQNKTQDGSNAVLSTSYTSTPKSATPVSLPCLSNLTPNSKSKSYPVNKQDTNPQNGKSKQELISPPTSKHSGITLMKIDPKTLSPIIAGANCTPSTPPLPHSPSPPSPLTPQNLKTVRPQPFPLPAHSNSSKGSPPLVSPFLPNLLYSSFPFPGMVGGNRMGAGPSPLVRAPGGMGLGAYHPLPPSINMLFNPHHRTHTHNSATSGSQSPSLVPPPAVQRMPASGAHHKNSPSPTGMLNKSSPAHSPPPLPQPAKAHMTSRSSCSVSQTVSGPAPKQNALGTEGDESMEREVQKTVSVEVTRTLNGEQNDEVNIAADNSGKQGSNSHSSNNSNGDGGISSGDGENNSTSATVQGISNVNDLAPENKVVFLSSENEQQTSEAKNENADVVQSQLLQKQEANESVSNKGGESKENAVEENKIEMENT